MKTKHTCKLGESRIERTSVQARGFPNPNRETFSLTLGASNPGLAYTFLQVCLS